MNKKLWLIITILLAIWITLFLLPLNTESYKPPVLEQNTLPKISHRQETWIRVLEWCESGGRIEAVNPKDRDNTPSYGAFQFKPSTFTDFAKLYNVKGELMDRDAQYDIVVNMVAERDNINWKQQFPDCVKKYGFPPKP